MGSASTFVQVSVSVSSAPVTPQEAFGVPMVLAYFTHWSDRLRIYETDGLSAAMIADNFSVDEAAYLAAQVIAEQPNPPSQIAIGRRALAPQQHVTLTCTDGLPGDQYAFMLVGSDGSSHAITYPVLPNPGSNLTSSATTNVSNGSASVTFSVAQTLAKGGALVFGTGAQPGTYYFLSANVAASTAGTLTTNYTGTTNTTAPTTYTAPLTGTFTTTGSPGATIPSTASQVGVVNPGDAIMFASQPGVYYQVLSVTAAHIVLTSAFTGTGASTDNAVDLSPTSYAASQIEALIAAIPSVASIIGTVSVTGSVISWQRTDGALTNITGWSTGPVQNILLSNVTADPGIATDLAAVYAANKTAWYGLVIDSNSKAEILAAQAFIEATGQGGKFAFYDNADLADVTSATTDVFSQLQSESYQKCCCIYSGQSMLSWAGAAAAGYALGRTPGSYNLAYKTLVGVPADVDTSLSSNQAFILNTQSTAEPGSGGKNGNYYQGIPNDTFLWPGSTPNGNFVDTVIFVDWVQSNVQAAIISTLRAAPKVPYTDNGIGQVKDAISGVLQTGAANGGIDGSQPITVTVPKAASIAPATKLARNLPGVTSVATLAGAIDTVSALQITLVP